MLTQAEGLIAELNRTDCYDFINQFCEQLSSHLAAMSKQKYVKPLVTSLASELADLDF